VRVPDAQIGYLMQDWLTMGQVLSCDARGWLVAAGAGTVPGSAIGKLRGPRVKAYLDLLRAVRERGTRKDDRTGTGTLSVFGWQMRFDLAAGFPMVTTKRVHVPSVVHELLWFLRGETNTRYLREHGVTIWDEWADAGGELGPVYGAQWRAWGAADGRSIDQLSQVVQTLKSNPIPAMIVSAVLANWTGWRCCLHALFQFYVAEGRLSCQLYQRSADVPGRAVPASMRCSRTWWRSTRFTPATCLDRRRLPPVPEPSGAGRPAASRGRCPAAPGAHRRQNF
jgi:hypothetical protein